jgi:hypothetical protein
VSATAGVDGLFASASATVEGHFDHTNENSQSQSQSGSFDVSYNGDTSTASTEDTENSVTQTFHSKTPAGEHCTFTVHTVKCTAKATGSIKIVVDGVAWTGKREIGGGPLIGFRLNELPVKDRTIEIPLTSDINSDSTNADVTNDCGEIGDEGQSSKTGNNKTEDKKGGNNKDDNNGSKGGGKQGDNKSSNKDNDQTD